MKIRVFKAEDIRRSISMAGAMEVVKKAFFPQGGIPCSHRFNPEGTGGNGLNHAGLFGKHHGSRDKNGHGLS
jgi:hypothetical protein